MKRHARKDPVTPSLRLAVLERDRMCVLSAVDPDHFCTNRWGERQGPFEDLTLEHVKDQLRAGRRAPSDLGHLVAMCYGGNVGVPSKAQRELLRGYLRGVYLSEPQEVTT